MFCRFISVIIHAKIFIEIDVKTKELQALTDIKIHIF